MDCQNPACGRGIMKDQFCIETPDQFRKRLESGYCRPKCKRLSAPARPERVTGTLELRSCSVGAVELAAQEKELTPRSEKYKAFIREQPCLLLDCGMGPCDGDVVPHHSASGGMSIKGSDFSCLPLCNNHHHLMDDAGKKGRGIWTERELSAIVTRLNEDYNWQQKYKEKRP